MNNLSSLSFTLFFFGWYDHQKNERKKERKKSGFDKRFSF